MIFINELAHLLKCPSLIDPIPTLVENGMGRVCAHRHGPGGVEQGVWCQAGEGEGGVILSLFCAVCISSSQRHRFNVGFTFPPLGFALKFVFH